MDFYALAVPEDATLKERIRACIYHSTAENAARNATGKIDYFISGTYETGVDVFQRRLLLDCGPLVEDCQVKAVDEKSILGEDGALNDAILDGTAHDDTMQFGAPIWEIEFGVEPWSSGIWEGRHSLLNGDGSEQEELGCDEDEGKTGDDIKAIDLTTITNEDNALESGTRGSEDEGEADDSELEIQDDDDPGSDASPDGLESGHEGNFHQTYREPERMFMEEESEESEFRCWSIHGMTDLGRQLYDLLGEASWFNDHYVGCVSYSDEPVPATPTCGPIWGEIKKF